MNIRYLLYCESSKDLTSDILCIQTAHVSDLQTQRTVLLTRNCRMVGPQPTWELIDETPKGIDNQNIFALMIDRLLVRTHIFTQQIEWR